LESKWKLGVCGAAKIDCSMPKQPGICFFAVDLVSRR
jgi:hypothetical protein